MSNRLPVTNHLMLEAAQMLSRAIGKRWDGWHSVALGLAADGSDAILVAFDAAHMPPLSVSREYQGYPVQLVPSKKPRKTKVKI